MTWINDFSLCNGIMTGKNSTGPKIFLKRLTDMNLDVSGVSLINPDIKSVEAAKKINTLIIGRLDGTSYYDFSRGSLKNFLLLRGKEKLSKISSLVPEFFLQQKFNYFFNRYLDRTNLWLLKNADALVFQSRLSLEMHKKFLSFSEKDKPHAIIHNGVDTQVFTPNLHRKRSYQELDLIISGSLYRAHKRLSEAIKLVNSLSNRYPNIKLHILGDLDLITSESIKKIDKSHCNFYGKVSHDSLPHFYRQADLQLHLSIFDPCPNVVVEGLSCGLPVITPLESGASELVGDENREWSISENLDMRYYNLHNASCIPQISLQRYRKAVINVVDNLTEHQRRARKRAEQALEIRSIAKQYNSFIEKVKFQNV